MKMPLHPRSISISIAVVCLFVISFIGWFAGLAPLTCCKRAVIGAVASYFTAKIVVNIVNYITISALVKFRMEAQKGTTGGHGS